MGTTTCLRLLVVAPRRTISRPSSGCRRSRSASISPRRMPVSSATMIIERRCGDATCEQRSSSSSDTRRRRLLSSRSAGSGPRCRGGTACVPGIRADRPVQHVAQETERPVDRRRRRATGPRSSLTTRGFFRSATKSSMSAVRFAELTIAEALEQRLEAIVDRAGQRQPFGDDVTRLVDLGERAKRHAVTAQAGSPSRARRTCRP